ncbi:Holliday junction resolvase RuvX [Candidatus Comchoanobacter bicostacola]|uniref:Putative pre-16S rRNA nuclease n=1 Tax=Candidatus Comchoanobacter bicostacola TaxID=2919598 RepID=A0ABY5DK91_9GAMM|nr:Holliday junction resolvase RuvX [Candidatus Comchoanobacter bicostacola]UTC24575.1 Holliday junction resolvase RuvX [Candidatus Comchoanobacter bicostacola]
MILLGVDYGTKYWGCAVGSSATGHADPLGSLKVIHQEPDWKTLDQWVKEWRPDAVVIGVPLKMDGTPFKVTKKAQAAAETLRDRYGLTVYEADERMSTVEAKDELFDHKGKKALTKSNVDTRSAQIILERWIYMNL